MWTKKFLFFWILFSTFFVYSQEREARRIVETLCSDTFYGRGYVNNGVNIAANFLEDEFKKVGLTPFFGDTSYVQNFQFDVNTFPGTMRIVSDDYFYQAGVDYLVDENSGSYTGNLFFVEIDSSYITDRAKFLDFIHEVKTGKYNAILVDLTKVSSENRLELTSKFNGFSEIGTVIYLTDQKFTWSVGKAQAKFPIIYFKKEVFANSLLYINIEAELIKEFNNRNLIGYLPSKKRNPEKAKTLVFTAHYDHLGAMGTTPNLTLFPGGNDNASGTSMLISLADYFKKNPSKYNLVFIAFAGEEAGLIGSKYFVDSEAMDLSEIKFLVNLDIMGSGEEGITVVNGSVYKDQYNKLVKINRKKNYLTQIKVRGEAANSDHWYFYKAGVPSIFIYTMGPNKHYHDVYDTYEELSFASYDKIVKLLIDFTKKF